MDIMDVIEDILVRQGIMKRTLASRLNISPSTINTRFARGNIRADTMVKMLRALDYKLVAMPANKKTPDGGYDIGE